MSFLHDAQEFLTADELETLKSLQQKSAEFEATPSEEKQLYDLKDKVNKAVANRDKLKNLSIIGNKAYSLEEILNASGFTNDEIKKHFVKMFAKAPETPVDFMKFKNGNTDVTFNTANRITKADKEFIVKAGMKAIVDSVTDMSWAMKMVIPTKGISAKKETYPNVKMIATKLGVNADELYKELKKRKDAESKKENAKEEEKQSA